MDKYVIWGETKSEVVVWIEPSGSVSELLKPGVIEAELKTPNLQSLGIIVDADDQRDARWASISQRCQGVIADFPKKLPPEGLIHVTPTGFRVGVWIMPDNQSTGMLETFLSEMVPSDQNPLWTFARNARAEAKGHGASNIDAHRDKADIHTFLAWVNPPGQQLHTAVMRKSLDAQTPLGQRFAQWFVELFQLVPRDPAIFQ